MRFKRERLLDYIRGLDFTMPASKYQAGTSDVEEALYYESSAFVPELGKALNYLNISESDAILDYGSGKGAVLAKLSNYPFKRICGIELSERLNVICRSNFKKLGLNSIEVIVGDATYFININEFNYFYFFNPFSGEIFKRVIQNIIASYDVAPRPIIIIYYHPKCHESIMQSGRFELIRQFKDAARTLNIYKIKT